MTTTMKTTTTDRVRDTIAREFRGELSVTTRRPGAVFQVHIPAFFSDGDAASIFARPREDGGLELTDLGITEMRVSYHGDLTPQVRSALAGLAREHGVTVDDGELVVPAREGEVLAAILAILQVQTRAEHIARAAVTSEKLVAEFRAAARQLLREMFGDALQEKHAITSIDPSGLYALDGYVERAAGPPLCFSLVSGGMSAEQAVATRHALRPGLAKTMAKFVALPSDLERLPALSRRRLIDSYDTIACSAWDEEVVRAKLGNI